MPRSLLHSACLSIAAAAVAAVALSQPARAEYPERRVTLVVGFAAGGFADTMARFIGQKLSERWGQPVIIENRGGAGGNIAARTVTQADADGYTFLVTTTAIAINETMYRKRNYSIDQLVPVAIPGFSPETFAGAPDRPSTMKDLIAARTGKEISFSTAGVGSGSHLAAEYFFRNIAKVKAVHVPFRGGAPAVQAALARQVDLVETSFGAAPYITQGKLHGLAVAADRRVPSMPDVPTFKELGYADFEAGSWVGVFAPAKTDPKILVRVNEAINAIIADKANADRLTRTGFVLTNRNTADTAAYLKAEVAKWATMVKAVGVYVD